MDRQKALNGLWGTLVIALISVACGGGRVTNDLKFDSAANVALDGVITRGVVITDSDNDEVATRQAKEQLMYSIGQLNGIYGGVDMPHAVIAVGTKTPQGGGKFKVEYRASMMLSWPRSMQIPQTYTLYMPARGDAAGREAFFDTFGADESGRKQCLADDAHEVGVGSFWYYYRPLKNSCPATGSSLTIRTPIALTLSAENTQGKAPEYGKIWEDGKLQVTAVFSKYESGATSANDAGIAIYRSHYYDLLNTFGSPISTSLPQGQSPSATNDEIRVVFRTSKGPLEVSMFLLDSVGGARATFVERYNVLSATADFVSYDGHSGLGANIRALTRMGRFQTGQYQVFLLNGCDSFSYVDNALRQAHTAVNPTYGPDKFVDIITNARPSQFNQMSRATMAVVRSLVGGTRTYRQILADFDDSQRAAVTGEQDNRWPQPF